jgi:antitoxin component YwqK of YwqJK toxin-antitoxin module
MKKYIILSAILFTGVTFAQENNPKLEAVGELVKTTYYFENGKVQQEGFFKNGKLDGVWTSYDVNGNKLAVATYDNGEKTGKWFFWTGTNLNEVDYSNSRIASVKTWKKDALVTRD